MKIFSFLYFLGIAVCFSITSYAGPLEDLIEALDSYSDSRIDQQILNGIKNSAESIHTFDYRLNPSSRSEDSFPLGGKNSLLEIYPDSHSSLALTSYLSLWQAINKHIKQSQFIGTSLKTEGARDELSALLEPIREALFRRESLEETAAIELKTEELRGRVLSYASKLNRIIRTLEIKQGPKFEQITKILRQNPEILTADLSSRVDTLTTEIRGEEELLSTKRSETKYAQTQYAEQMEYVAQAKAELSEAEERRASCESKIKLLSIRSTVLTEECASLETRVEMERKRAEDAFAAHLKTLIVGPESLAGDTLQISIIGLENSRLISSLELRTNINEGLKALLHELYLLSPWRDLIRAQSHSTTTPVPTLELYAEILRATPESGVIWSTGNTLLTLILKVKASTSLFFSFDQEIFRDLSISPQGQIDLKQNKENLRQMRAFLSGRMMDLLPRATHEHIRIQASLQAHFFTPMASAPAFEASYSPFPPPPGEAQITESLAKAQGLGHGGYPHSALTLNSGGEPAGLEHPLQINPTTSHQLLQQITGGAGLEKCEDPGCRDPL